MFMLQETPTFQEGDGFIPICGKLRRSLKFEVNEEVGPIGGNEVKPTGSDGWNSRRIAEQGEAGLMARFFLFQRKKPRYCK